MDVAVGYLDVRGRVLLESRVEVGYELRAQLDSERGQMGVIVFPLERLLEFVLGYSQHRCSALGAVSLRHG